MIVKIEKKKADLALFGFAVNQGRIKVAHFLPSMMYTPNYWWTRYPLPTTRMWNLIYLFSPACWMWTFLSIASIVISLKIASMIGERLGIILVLKEITLFPFWYLSCPSVNFNYRIPPVFRIRIVETPTGDRDTFFSRGFSHNLCLNIWNMMAGFLM